MSPGEALGLLRRDVESLVGGKVSELRVDFFERTGIGECQTDGAGLTCRRLVGHLDREFQLVAFAHEPRR